MPLDLQFQLAARILLALGIGLVIGIEREIRGRDAGIRTMAMVGAGSCLFTSAGLFFPSNHLVDPTRIAAQVVTGIGFLGAGAIFRTEDRVKGLTTAATVWVVAALGMAVGFGAYVLALVGTLIVMLSLIGVRPLEDRLFKSDVALLRRRSDRDETG